MNGNDRYGSYPVGTIQRHQILTHDSSNIALLVEIGRKQDGSFTSLRLQHMDDIQTFTISDQQWHELARLMKRELDPQTP